MNRFSVSLLVLLATSVTATAQQAKPNTLTAKEIADGWILLFDGDTTFGWKTDGDVKVVDGILRLKKKQAARQTSMFGTFEMEFDYMADGDDSPRLLLGGADVFNLRHLKGNKDWHHARLRATFDPKSKPAWEFAGASGPLGGPPTHNEVFHGSNKSPMEFSVGAGASLTLRNVKLKPTNQTPVFNGKDLTGWKEIEGKKSKFTVNDKGELNIKDGPGDLQTTGAWDDFVLQLDVFSNGKHLNSGVFFRCQPGQFWSGYEAQIRNQWLGDDRTKAVDYGTGGIYNRQAARKVVSSDKEWFTMTVVAHGSHLATWVNGYQVTDFTDTRKADASARKGLKVDKGPISLQGHDPTTDLSFRNIRVAAMPKSDNPKK